MSNMPEQQKSGGDGQGITPPRQMHLAIDSKWLAGVIPWLQAKNIREQQYLLRRARFGRRKTQTDVDYEEDQKWEKELLRLLQDMKDRGGA